MVSSALLSSVIADLYDAALEPGLWTRVLPSIASIFDSQQVAYNVLDASGRTVPFIAAHGLGADDFELFRAFAATTDTPQWFQTAPADRPSLRSAASPDREFSRTSYYNEVIRPSGSFYALRAGRPRRGATHRLSGLKGPRIIPANPPPIQTPPPLSAPPSIPPTLHGAPSLPPFPSSLSGVFLPPPLPPLHNNPRPPHDSHSPEPHPTRLLPRPQTPRPQHPPLHDPSHPHSPPLPPRRPPPSPSTTPAPIFFLSPPSSPSPSYLSLQGPSAVFIPRYLSRFPPPPIRAFFSLTPKNARPRPLSSPYLKKTPPHPIPITPPPLTSLNRNASAKPARRSAQERADHCPFFRALTP